MIKRVRGEIPAYPGKKNHAWDQINRHASELKKLGIRPQTAFGFSAAYEIPIGEKQTGIPHAIFLRGKGEDTLYVNENAEVPTNNFANNFCVLLRTRSAFRSFIRRIWGSLTPSESGHRNFGYVFDDRSGYFAIKNNPNISHHSTSESFTICESTYHRDPMFLKGTFGLDSKKAIISLFVTFLDPKAAEAKDDEFLEAILFQLAIRLKYDLKLPPDLIVCDTAIENAPPRLTSFLKKRGIKTLGELFSRFSGIGPKTNGR